MKYRYGKKSRENLETVDQRLFYIFQKVLKNGLIDISILTGERGE